MKKTALASLAFLGVSILLSACAPHPAHSWSSGANQVFIGSKKPSPFNCTSRGFMHVEYGNGVTGHFMKTYKLRQHAQTILRTEAYSRGANYVFLKEEDAKIAGLFKYQMATSIRINAQAFKCKVIPN